MANNGPTYTRLGPGDLPGNPNHPGSPDYVEPAFGADDATHNVAARLTEQDEVAPLVADLMDAMAALRWIAQNVEFPDIDRGYYCDHRAKFRALLRRGEQVENQIAAELEALNAPGGEA